MNIRDLLSSIDTKANNPQDSISGALGNIRSLFGSTSASLSHVWNGGFAGIDAARFDDLKVAMNSYVNSVQESINEFSELGAMTRAYKGMDNAIIDYISSIKNLLNAYVSTLKRDIVEADMAFQNYQAAAKSIAMGISNDAQMIRSQAGQIKID